MNVFIYDLTYIYLFCVRGFVLFFGTFSSVLDIVLLNVLFYYSAILWA